MSVSRVIEVSFGGGSIAYAKVDTAYFYNNGILFKPTDIDLPASYQVHWADSPQASSTLETIGTAEGAPIPDDLWNRSRVIYGWIYLHPTEDSGVTGYEVRIYKNVRAGLPDGTEPTPAEQSTIDQLIGALNSAVEQTGEDVESASQSAQSAESAKTAAESARDTAGEYANDAESSAASASTSASQASTSATASAQSASQSAQIKADVEDLVDDAQGYTESASQSASQALASEQGCARAVLDAASAAAIARARAEEASGYAQTASAKASEASTSASTASTKASEAAQSATNASQSAQTAEQAKTASQTAQGLAESARDSAVQAKTDAESARDDAESARDAVQSSAAQITTNAEDITQLKEDLNKFYSDKTETGKIFRFGESDGVLKVVSDSEVTVGNQNILDTPLLNYNEYTNNGVTYQKQADGSIRISGTATANTNIWLNQTAKFPKGTYTLSGCPHSGSSSTYRMICNYRISGVDYTWLIDTGNGFTADLTEDIDNIRCAITIFNGATVDLTFYPQLEYASTKSEYATCANETVSANTEISIDGIKTIFGDTTFNLTVGKYGWIDDVVNLQNAVNALADNIEDADDSILSIKGLLSNNIRHFNIDDYSLVCVHHDNFSRTMNGWEIGMNAGGTDTGNNYEWVTASTYDDGMRVGDGATFEANSSRTNNFSLRKIATNHADDFVIETNAPTANNQVAFGYNVTNVNDFTILSALKQTNGYRVVAQKITNNSLGDVIMDVGVNAVLAKVLTFCFDNQWIYVLADDQLIISRHIGEVGNELYLASYKGATVHYDFINVFNIRNHIEWNPNYILDTGVSEIPLVVTSANDGGYTLQDDNTRWSDYADKFLLNSTDPLVHNGHRSERSVANLAGYTGNLRHLKISFDVYFPSTSVDAERNDIMMQMHDRDGTYRGFVPFILNFDNNKIKITLASTHVPKDGADDVLKWVEGVEIASISTDEWHRFDLEIKERYDEDQNPFVKIFIDSKLVFESRKPNCFNDLLGSSPQYGIYKNLWGTGVTTFERYFDNFKIEY